MSDVGGVSAASGALATAVLGKVQDNQEQQGKAAVSLIEAAGEVQKNVDPGRGGNIDIQA